MIYVKDSVHYTRRNDLEPLNIECIWIEIQLKQTRILFGLFYRPPNSDALYLSAIEDSISLALDTQISNIIVTGDFNFNVLNPHTSNKISDICTQFSLYQTITELVTFNPIKTEALLISRKLQTFNHPPLFMLNQQIMEVDTHKHLGIYLSNDGSWHKQISYIKEKAWARINIMRRLKFVLDRKSLETIYISFIRPILEYGNEIWDNCQQYEKDDLEKIQIEAARIATGTTKLVSIASLYSEIGWNSLDTRRKMQNLVLFYKMVNHLTPLYLSFLIPPTVNQTSRYNLRNASNISTINARTNQYFNSFLPSTIRDWNSLSEEHRNSTSVASFKHTLNQTNISVPKYFYVGDRRPQVLHKRLCTKCSALNYEIYLKNLTDTPLCRCGNIENSEHFFLQCRYYHRQRLEMIQTISPLCHITLDVLLFGDSSLSMNTNTSIFTAVQKFIVETKRV